MARPRKDITDEQIAQVEKLAAVLNQEQIGDFLGFSDRTFRRRMQEDERVLSAYYKGKSQAIAGVATNLLKQAKDGNTTAAIFYLKTQACWKETTAHEVSGSGGLPLAIDVQLVRPDGD